MRSFATIVSAIFLFTLAAAAPLKKRAYQATSPVFSLIAHHEGKKFQYSLVKFDGQDLVLGTDEPAFFGSIQAADNYSLNIAYSNNSGNFSTDSNLTNASFPLSANIYVDKDNKLTTNSNNVSSHGFGISHSYLSYHNSTKFLACPIVSNSSSKYSNKTKSWKHYNSTLLNSTSLNSTNYTRGPYDIYLKTNTTTCPQNLTGFDITLLVQVSAAINFGPDSNTKRRQLEAPLSGSVKREAETEEVAIPTKRSIWTYFL